MSDNFTKRLRDKAEPWHEASGLLLAAADAIERLEGENERLRGMAGLPDDWRERIVRAVAARVE